MNQNIAHASSLSILCCTKRSYITTKRRCAKCTVIAMKLIDDLGWQALIDEMSSLDEHEHEVSEHFSSTLAAALVSVAVR